MPVIVEKEQQQPCNENGDDNIEQLKCPTHGNGEERGKHYIYIVLIASFD